MDDAERHNPDSVRVQPPTRAATTQATVVAGYLFVAAPIGYKTGEEIEFCQVNLIEGFLWRNSPVPPGTNTTRFTKSFEIPKSRLKAREGLMDRV